MVYKKYQGLMALLLLLPLAALASEPLKTIKLTNDNLKMRAVDRGWEYFNDVPCDVITQLQAYSDSEQALIKQRKSACTKKYDAFFSKPLER